MLRRMGSSGTLGGGGGGVAGLTKARGGLRVLNGDSGSSSSRFTGRFLAMASQKGRFSALAALVLLGSLLPALDEVRRAGDLLSGFPDADLLPVEGALRLALLFPGWRFSMLNVLSKNRCVACCEPQRTRKNHGGV